MARCRVTGTSIPGGGITVTFADYLLILQRRWRVWATALVLGLGAAIFYNALAPVEYTAVAGSFVTVQDPGADQSANFQNSQFAVQRVKSYAPLASSPSVIDPVIDELGLTMTPRELRQMVSVTSPPDTVLMQVAVTDTDPKRAAAIADAVSAELGSIIEDLETPRGHQASNVKVTLTRPADIPVKPSSPRVLLNLLLGLVAGGAIGFLAAVLRHTLDRRVKTEEDVRLLTNMSPLGSTLFERDGDRRPLVALDGRSASSERYRTVRTALKFATVDTDLRHFVITSPIASDGKSTAACNLAITWAQSGASVCLVEADLRRPGVSRLLGIEGNIGLSDVLVDEAQLDDVLIAWNRVNITVLPAGSLPPDPAALLGSDAMQALVGTLRSRFDIVIYDSAPLLAVTDAVVLGQALDGVVVVVRSGVTSRDHLTTCFDTIQRARLPLLGTILASTKVSGRNVQHYFAYHSVPTSTDRVELPAPEAESGPEPDPAPKAVVSKRADSQEPTKPKAPGGPSNGGQVTSGRAARPRSSASKVPESRRSPGPP